MEVKEYFVSLKSMDMFCDFNFCLHYLHTFVVFIICIHFFVFIICIHFLFSLFAYFFGFHYLHTFFSHGPWSVCSLQIQETCLKYKLSVMYTCNPSQAKEIAFTSVVL